MTLARQDRATGDHHFVRRSAFVAIRMPSEILFDAVRDLKVGGMIVVNRVVSGSVRNAEPYAMAAFLNRMQRLAKVPLLVGADFERGASMRVSGRRNILI